jgi:NAD(P)H-dependent FMN reductase
MHASTEVLDLNDFEMPLFSVDREQAGGIPDFAHQFYKKVGAADALLVSFAEHNGSYSAAYKNLFDWTSRIDNKVYQGTKGNRPCFYPLLLVQAVQAGYCRWQKGQPPILRWM